MDEHYAVPSADDPDTVARDALHAALRAQADADGVRYSAIVSTSGDDQAEGPEAVAAHLLGYLHRYDDVPILVYDRVADEIAVLRARELLEIARARPDGPVGKEMLDWSEPPQYEGL